MENGNTITYGPTNAALRTAVVRCCIVTVVKVCAYRYDVDGIHFDDYFYPYPDSVGTPFPDDVTYRKYVDANGTLSRDDWRRHNVNNMVNIVMHYAVVSIPQQLRVMLKMICNDFLVVKVNCWSYVCHNIKYI